MSRVKTPSEIEFEIARIEAMVPDSQADAAAVRIEALNWVLGRASKSASRQAELKAAGIRFNNRVRGVRAPKPKGGH